MNDQTTTMTRDDLIGIALAVLMFALQGAMLLSMSCDSVAAARATRSGMIAAAGFDAGDRPA